MGLSDDELARKRQYVADLTAQLEAAKTANATTLREQENEIEGARLDAAAVNLEAQLAAVMAAGEPARIAKANEPVLEQADKEMTQSVEFHEARIASEKAREEVAKEAAENPVRPEDVGIAADELARREAERENADKEPEPVQVPETPPTPSLPDGGPDAPTQPNADDNKNQGGDN